MEEASKGQMRPRGTGRLWRGTVRSGLGRTIKTTWVASVAQFVGGGARLPPPEFSYEAEQTVA
jgi:hypothetical protein